MKTDPLAPIELPVRTDVAYFDVVVLADLHQHQNVCSCHSRIIGCEMLGSEEQLVFTTLRAFFLTGTASCSFSNLRLSL